MIAAALSQMSSGDRERFEAYGVTVEVSYWERQAHGDNGQPVPGDTVGEFTVYWPRGSEEIHVGPGPHAKPYHAERIAARMMSLFFEAKMKALSADKEDA